jgi:carbamate kinase
MTQTAVIAYGGNALVREAGQDSIPDQYETVCTIAPGLVDLIERGWRLVVSHGNGPQVGFILRRSEIAVGEVNPVPVDYAVADTQGAIGYMFVKAIANELKRRGLDRPVVTVVTQTVVDAADPAFRNPSKPIGAFLDAATAEARKAALGWTIMEDAGRGWRRSIASPRPQRIVESGLIGQLLDLGAVVVAGGGGGVAVTEDAKGLVKGVEAVVDKDLASALLAAEIGADMLILPTGVSRVAVNFGTPGQKWLDRLSVTEARRYIAEGEFGKGSMEPKVAAVADFVAARPSSVGAIGAPDELAEIIEGKAGTHIMAYTTDGVLLAINGTLMRGLKLNPNMHAAGATFVREDLTQPVYRIWSVNDDHPAMVRQTDGSGISVPVEVWLVPAGGLAGILIKEPPGLSIGKAVLAGGETVLAVLGEPALVERQREITSYGGWRAYIAAENVKS